MRRGHIIRRPGICDSSQQGGDKPTKHIMKKRRQLLPAQHRIHTNDDHPNEKRHHRRQPTPTNHDRHQCGQPTPPHQGSLKPIGCRRPIQAIQNLRGNIRGCGARLNRPNKPVHLAQLRKIRPHIRHHPKHADRKLLLHTNGGEHGNGIQRDIHMHIVQTISRGHRMNLHHSIPV